MPEDILFKDGARLNLFLRCTLSVIFLVPMVRRNLMRTKVQCAWVFFVGFIWDFANEKRFLLPRKWCDANIELIERMRSKKNAGFAKLRNYFFISRMSLSTQLH